ncbi:MAG: YkgJ family cysteine cluster protein [Akkermansia muciniphila]|uniref:YkgJ family cysteine cluster protein n=1 Tax=Akkermansia muciniphila TaxID=239935 RepID=UPI00319E4330
MARGKCRQGKAGGMAPAAGMLMEVRRLLDEGAFRASRAQRFCTGAADCCRFRLTGETPHVTLGEAWVAWKAWRASGRTRLELPPDGSCPFLSGQGRCMIYEGRPLACRTHFCVPAGGALPRWEVIDLIHALEDIDAALGGDGAARLPEAVERLSRKGPADGRKRRR